MDNIQQEPIIELKNVTKRLSKKDIIKDISFGVYPNEIFGIIGASGAGKTTLMRTMIGYYRIDKGDVLINNKNISKNLNKIREIIGFASQENCVYDELTVAENLEYFGKLHHLTNEQIMLNTDSLLNLVELYDVKDKLTKNLSGGMKRRVDLACALIHNPKILIMDEPTTGLDPMLRKHMWYLIKIINDSGTTVIISSHLLDEMEYMCTRVGIISEGRLLAAGTPRQLKDLYSKNVEIHLETYPGRYDMIIDMLKAENLPVNFFSNNENKLVLYTMDAENVLHNTLHILEKLNERLIDVDVNKPSLNEVFEAFTQRFKNVK